MEMFLFIVLIIYLPGIFITLMFNNTSHKVSEIDENKIKAISDR